LKLKTTIQSNSTSKQNRDDDKPKRQVPSFCSFFRSFGLSVNRLLTIRARGLPSVMRRSFRRELVTVTDLELTSTDRVTIAAFGRHRILPHAARVR
jgi:hypothetical protein